MNQELKIEDLLGAMVDKTEVYLRLNDTRWIPGTVVGIDLLSEQILFQDSVSEGAGASWHKIYFQLNVNHPKTYHVVIDPTPIKQFIELN